MLLLGISLLLLTYTINVGIRFAYTNKIKDQKEQLLEQLEKDNEKIKDDMPNLAPDGLNIYVYENSQTDGEKIILFPTK